VAGTKGRRRPNVVGVRTSVAENEVLAADATAFGMEATPEWLRVIGMLAPALLKSTGIDEASLRVVLRAAAKDLIDVVALRELLMEPDPNINARMMELLYGGELLQPAS
jgi:hypothetical protein